MSDVRVENSSGNVFADLKLPNPSERLQKANIALRIKRALTCITPAQAAEFTNVSAETITDILHGNFNSLSIEAMEEICKDLGKIT